MKAPLQLDGLAQLEPHAAIAAEILWLLGKVDEYQAQQVRVPAGDPVQNLLGVLLSAQVFVQSISPLNPRTLLGPHGEEHLAEVWRKLRVPEAEIAAKVATERAQMQRTMGYKAAITAAHHMWYSHEQRLGTAVDLQNALAADRIVSVQPRNSDGDLLLLPGTGDVECWLYSPITHTATESTVLWVEFGTLPLYTIYSAVPF